MPEVNTGTETGVVKMVVFILGLLGIITIGGAILIVYAKRGPVPAPVWGLAGVIVGAIGGLLASPKSVVAAPPEVLAEPLPVPTDAQFGAGVPVALAGDLVDDNFLPDPPAGNRVVPANAPYGAPL